MDIAGWKPLIVCGTATTPSPCEFEHLILLARHLIHDLVILSTFLAMVAFVYAGYVLLTSQGNPGALTKAKHVFTSVLIGYLVVLGAWLLVYTITSALLDPKFNFLLGKPQ